VAEGLYWGGREDVLDGGEVSAREDVEEGGFAAGSVAAVVVIC
jgi:hypothetical protein